MASYLDVRKALQAFIESRSEANDFWSNSFRTVLESYFSSDDVIRRKTAGYLNKIYNHHGKNIFKKHKGIGTFGILDESYLSFLTERAHLAASLITARKNEQVEKQVARFLGWASGQPDKEGSKKVVSGVVASKQELSFEQQRINVDQGHKMLAAIDESIGEQYGVIAKKWRHVISHRSYDPRPEHVARDGKVYAVKGRHADLGNGFWESLPDHPSELPFCRCWAENIYTERDLKRALS